jgi:hydroxymethylbilane synthase
VAADPADQSEGTVFLRGAAFAVDGTTSIRRSGTGTLADAESVGRRLAAELLDAGADSLLESAR